MYSKWILIFVLSVVTFAVGVIAFVHLNAQMTFSPGWTEPIELPEAGGSLSLLVHDGTLLLAFRRGGNKGPEIAITYSVNGREWSPPYSVVQETEKDYSLKNPEWLKRPNGDIWLVWNSRMRNGDNIIENVYYGVLREDKTLSDPQIIHSCDGELYSFSEIGNTPQGGLAILEIYTPLVTVTIQGRKVQGTIHTHCVVRSTNEALKWGKPVLLSKTIFAGSVDLLLDDQNTLWAAYTEYPPGETFFRTSKDGKNWSEPHTVSARSSFRFIQRHNKKYVLFFGNYKGVYMMTSTDGVIWSNSSLVMPVRECYSVGVAESDDGILWAVIDGTGCFCVTHYTDEKYLEDMETLKDFHIKNGIKASGIALVFGGICLILQIKFINKGE
jgi:hypothetical protein